ncbi:MAG: hypothetical protein BEN19_03195 [Epulopiscium sp. Nuni2H_MBin003]|nr:MAG: hypothetical protein BEN19_03195 [Epulopiscium sp. Nuni2H_MBin003]
MGYALITGASSGIGAALALKLGKEGYDLILLGRDTAKLDKLSRMITELFRVCVLTYKVDLRNEAEIKNFIIKLEKINRPITIFVNNAGVGSFGEFAKTEMDIDIINVNIKATTMLVKMMIPLLEKDAHILQVASTAGFTPGPYMAMYYASKAYMISFSLALRKELGDIKVSVLCPGAVKTNFQARANIQKVGYVKFLQVHPSVVAKVAYKGIMKNKPIIIVGLANKVIVNLGKILPYSMQTNIVTATQSKK